MREPWAGSPRAPRAWQADALPIIVAAMRRRERGLVSAIMGSGKSVLQAELAYLALDRLGDRAVVFVAPRRRLVRQLADTIGQRCGQKAVGVYYSEKKQPSRRIIVCCGASLPALHLALAERGRRVALMIVDEAHGSEAVTLRDTIPLVDPVCLVGFTATPFRSVPSETVSVFTSVLYRYTMDDAVRDGVLVPMVHRRYLGIREPGAVDEECLSMMREWAVGPGIVSATTIDDAEEYAIWLTDHDWPALAIHSRQSEREQEGILARLKAGDVRCLVHVSLLAEGVDLPWLRWLCLRRAVQARVRFLQEVGRVLRVCEGKTEGVVLDPHMLLGRHGLTTTEAIGQALEDAAEAESREPVERDGNGRTEQEVVALDLLLLYLDEVHGQLIGHDVIEERPFEARPGWEIASVSKRQVEAIEKSRGMTRHIPSDYRDPIKTLAKIPWALTSGQASRLIAVLWGGQRYARSRAKTRGMPAHRIQWPASYARAVAVPAADSVSVVNKIRRHA